MRKNQEFFIKRIYLVMYETHEGKSYSYIS